MKIKLLIVIACATPLIMNGMENPDTKKAKRNYIPAIRISSVKDVFKRRIIALKHHIQNIPEDLRGALGYFETSYHRIRRHYNKGYKSIDKKTYKELDKGLKELEKEANIHRIIKPHIKKTKDLQDYVFDFSQLPDFNTFMYQLKCWASIKQIVKYAGIISIIASLSYKAKKVYENYKQDKPQELPQKEQNGQINEKEKEAIIT